MSRFYVGQRVRILFSYKFPELNGSEGVIVRAAGPNPNDYGVIPDWVVKPDLWGSEFCPSGKLAGREFCPRSHQLAPAYDGNEKVSWSECLWQPTPERVA